MRAAIGFIVFTAFPLMAAPVPKEVRAGDDQRIVGVWKLTKAKFGDADFDSAIGTKRLDLGTHAGPRDGAADPAHEVGRAPPERVGRTLRKDQERRPRVRQAANVKIERTPRLVIEFVSRHQD